MSKIDRIYLISYRFYVVDLFLENVLASIEPNYCAKDQQHNRKEGVQ